MKVKFITLGCKTNYYESQAMSELFRKSGYEIAEKNEPSDIYVINTCTVTGTGAQKSRQHIRKAKKENPSAIIAVTGCFAQTEPEKVFSIDGVDVVVGTEGKKNIVEYVHRQRDCIFLSSCLQRRYIKRYFTSMYSVKCNRC